MFTLRNVLSMSFAFLAAALTSPAFAAYNFIEGYNVLDTNNAPIFATGDVGTNFAATAGQERDIAVDSTRGIIYMARGGTTTADRPGGVNGIAAIVVTNGARAGSNFRDTGLIVSSNGQPAMGFCQSLAYDPVADKLWVFGGTAASATPIIMSAPGGTLGGAPDGDNIAALSNVLVKEFQADSALGRGGAQRGFAVRTVDGITTVYLGMGSHVQAWRNDQPLDTTNSPWRRIWATLAPPAQNTVATRLASAASALNGLAVDDAGNCYFNVAGTTPARIWTVRPEIVATAADPMSLDFNDTYFGGANAKEILPLILIGSSSATDTNNPQAITFCRFGAQKTLFVSFLMSSATTRGVTRLDIDDDLSSANGSMYLRALVVDGFGSGQPAGEQDTILSSLRLKQNPGTQPRGPSNALLYHDVDSITNPTYIYLEGFVTDTNKGQTIPTAAVMKIRMGVNTNPPSIAVQPQPQTLLEGGTISLSVSAGGQKPLHYQWQSNSVDIPNATNEIFTFSPASTNDSSLYRVVVTNALGSLTSTQVQVTVQRLVRSAAMAPLWSVAAGSRYYLSNDNGQRGLAYNAGTGDLLVASRTPTNSIHVLSAFDGSDLFELKMDSAVIGGGTAGFGINMIGASEDGIIYVCNLAQNAEMFRIYRWSSEDTDTAPTVAFSAAANSLGANRFGDTFDVRGFADGIQIIAASRNSNVVAIFTTTDGGLNLTAHTIVVPGVTNGAFGLGVAFAGPDTFWGKGDSSTGLQRVQFDLASGTATVLNTYGPGTYPPGATVIGVETNRNVLAAIAVENPDNLRLYDLADLVSGPRLVDQELFPTDNDNINATGAIDFGDGKVFALDSNNGIIALTLGAIPPGAPGPITITRNGNSITLAWSGNYTLQSAPLVTGQYDDVPGATSGYTENVATAQQKYFRLRN